MSSSSGTSVSTGLFTSTTATTVSSFAISSALAAVINISSGYSPVLKRSLSGLRVELTSPRIICTFLLSVVAALQRPTAAPRQSISGSLCPIISIVSLFSISSLSACALTLALTLVVFSTEPDFPPKYLRLCSSLTTA